MRSSKICPVPPNSSQSTRLNTEARTSWHNKSECKKREAKNVASKFLSGLLNDVNTITTGVVYEKSSCSVIPIFMPAEKEEEIEDHRLVNWKKWLEIRERDSKKIARATLRHRKELLLNLNPNDCRKIFKHKEIIEKAIFDAGDLNFWKMPVKSREGLYVTAPKSQATNCERPEIVYTQTPDALLNEQKIKKEEEKSTLKILKNIEMRKKEKLIKTESFEKYQPRMEKLALTGMDLQLPCDVGNEEVSVRIFLGFERMFGNFFNSKFRTYNKHPMSFKKFTLNKFSSLMEFLSIINLTSTSKSISHSMPSNMTAHQSLSSLKIAAM